MLSVEWKVVGSCYLDHVTCLVFVGITTVEILPQHFTPLLLSGKNHYTMREGSKFLFLIFSPPLSCKL